MRTYSRGFRFVVQEDRCRWDPALIGNEGALDKLICALDIVDGGSVRNGRDEGEEGAEEERGAHSVE